MSTATAARKISFLEAVHDALDVALESDPAVFELGEDIQDPKGGGFGIHKGLSTKYGADRVRCTPISEQAIMGAAVGAAIAGMRPVAEIMLMNFISVAADQLFNHAAKLRYMSGGVTPVPLTVRTSTGAGAGFGAQHSDMLENQLIHVPGLKVVVPSTAADAKGLLLSSIFDDDPCVFVEMSSLYFAVKDEVPPGDHRVPLGVARVAREGTDLTILTYGKQVLDCLAVAEQLAGEGISLEVIDLRSLQPSTHRRSSARWPRPAARLSSTRPSPAEVSGPSCPRRFTANCSATCSGPSAESVVPTPPSPMHPPWNRRSCRPAGSNPQFARCSAEGRHPDMATEVRIPKLGVAVEEGQITDWLCEDGDVVEAGQPLYELATDKTEVEVESPASGRITIIGEIDQEYPVGTLIATIA